MKKTKEYKRVKERKSSRYKTIQKKIKVKKGIPQKSILKDKIRTKNWLTWWAVWLEKQEKKAQFKDSLCPF